MDRQTVRAIAEAFKKWEKAENCTFTLFGISDAGITIHYINKRAEMHHDKGSKFQYFAADIGDILRGGYKNILISHSKPDLFCIWSTEISGQRDYNNFRLAGGLQ